MFEMRGDRVGLVKLDENHTKKNKAYPGRGGIWYSESVLFYSRRKQNAYVERVPHQKTSIT